MSAYPQTYDLEDLMEGDKWKLDLSFRVEINGLNPEFPLSSAKMQFREASPGGKIGAELSTENGRILLVNPATWEISVPTIPAEEVPIKKGKWVYEIAFVDTQDQPLRPIRGNLFVFGNITRPAKDA